MNGTSSLWELRCRIYFQSVMSQEVLYDFLWEIGLQYVDYIVSWGKCIDTYPQNLAALFFTPVCLESASPPKKCGIGMTVVDLVGQMMSQTGIYLFREEDK